MSGSGYMVGEHQNAWISVITMKRLVIKNGVQSTFGKLLLRSL